MSYLRHKIEEVGLCLTCGKICDYCKQCKCEIKRTRTCPGFNVKKFPDQFEKWKKDREDDRAEGAKYWRAKKRKEEDYKRYVENMTRKYGPGSPGYVNYPGGEWPDHLTNRRRSARIDGGEGNGAQ